MNTGFLSHMICEMLDIDRTGRRSFLFDTFAGIPLDDVPAPELPRARVHNTVYFDVYETTQKLFESYSAVSLVRGVLPGSLSDAGLDKIAYLSIDMNYSTVEIACIRRLWPLLSPGAIVVLDDYAWAGHEEQKRAWDGWAREEGRSIYTPPGRAC